MDISVCCVPTPPMKTVDLLRERLRSRGEANDVTEDATQRKQIRLAYEDLYKEDLLKRLESELSGDFEKAVFRWIFDPIERQAILANVAVKKGIEDYRVIVEISCVSSPAELLAVKQAYHARFKRSLEEDVASHTTGDFRKIDGKEIDTKLASSEAKILHHAIVEKAFNHDEIIRILSTRSKAQLIATFNCYKDEFGASINKILRNALNKQGTDEDGLTRVIVTRAEKDLKVIKEIYHKRNNVTLDHAVAKETSGDYKAFLLALIGN
ncbi:hypothetical protein QJS10_CPB17g01823 [Acorus calamus]|uniref:Annexin n=1 Tax=Acorus calamus TaxID=4465 RepID=A0AAV9CSL0_ACOCL|nr:hypothetical protein QJS10_CPB17g01823 [Acorus calamus]